jgi:hypothetical protein
MCCIANRQPVSSDWFDLAGLVYNSARLYLSHAAFDQRPSACVIPWGRVQIYWLRKDYRGRPRLRRLYQALHYGR